MAETVGSLIDKLCINKLKVYHMQERLNNTEDNDTKKGIEGKLDVLQMQGDDLSDELEELLCDLVSGKKQIKVYRQFKT